MSIEVRSTEGTRLGIGRALRRTISSVWLPLLIAIGLAATAGADGLLVVVEQLRNQDMPGFTRSLLGLMLGHSLLCMLYGTGLAFALLDPKKRAVHDLLARSEVVYRMG
jgi:uncharacterized RDD family membrane protein YckC